MIGVDNYLINTSRTIPPNLPFNRIFISSSLVDVHTIGDQNYSFPLFIYHDDGTRTPNFDTGKLKELFSDIGPYCYTNERVDREAPPVEFWITAIDVMDYIYGVLHSPSYREKYKEFLKIDFPRVPKPTSPQNFAHYALLGRELRELHLMKHECLETYDTSYPIYDEAYDNVIDSVSYVKDTDTTGRVWINSQQYFGNVPELAWDFYIGGYQPAQKWLKDRKSRKLTNDDIDHYQKIIKVLVETDRIMKEIDLAE